MNEGKPIPVIAVGDVPIREIKISAQWSPGMTLAQLEIRAIILAVAYFSGNKTHAAKALGITTRTLRDKLKKHQGDHACGA